MPQVPRYGQSQVEERALPNVRSNIDAPIEAFGGGQANTVTDALSKLGKETGKIVHDEKVRADQTANRDYENKLKEFHVNQYAEGGVFRSQGKDAFTEAPNRFNEAFEKQKQDLLDSASNDEQRAYITQATTNEYNSMNKQLQAHMNAEFTKYDDSRTEHSVVLSQTMMETYYANSERLNKEYVDIVSNVHKNLSNKNVPTEEIIAKAEKAGAIGLFSAVQRRVVNGDINGAYNYYKANEKRFGPLKTETEKLFKDGRENHIATTAAMGYLKEYNDYYPASVAFMEKYKDQPEVIEKGLPFLKARMTEKNAAEKQVYTGRYTEGMAAIDQNKGDYMAIPQSVRDGLLPDDRAALKYYAQYIAGTAPPAKENNLEYQYYMNLTKEKLGEMTTTDLTIKVRPKVTPEQWGNIANKYTLAQKGINGEKEATYAYDVSGEDRAYLFNQMKSAGQLKSKSQADMDDKREVDLFYGAEKIATAKIQKEMIQNGGKISEERKKAIVKDVIGQKINTDTRSFGGLFGSANEKQSPFKMKDSKQIIVSKVDQAKLSGILKQYKIVPPTASDEFIKKNYGDKMKEVIFKSLRGELDSGKEIQQSIEILRGEE